MGGAGYPMNAGYFAEMARNQQNASLPQQPPHPANSTGTWLNERFMKRHDFSASLMSSTSARVARSIARWNIRLVSVRLVQLRCAVHFTLVCIIRSLLLPTRSCTIARSICLLAILSRSPDQFSSS